MLLKLPNHLKTHTPLDPSRSGLVSEIAAIAKALASGQITIEQVDVIADAAESLTPEAVDVELSASAASAPADVFAKRARRWVGQQETPATIEDRYRQQRSARSLTTWTSPDGMGMWMAKLDPVTNAAVTAAINTRYEQFWHDDGGRNPQPADTDTGTGTSDKMPAVRQQMLVTVDLTRMRSDNPHGAAHLIDGTPLPQTVLEELACGSEMTGIVFDGPSKPIWVGRTRRHATSSQQKALIARDQGCVGCKKAPDRCETHHIKPWHDGGATNIDNLVLVCSQCHHNIHNRRMQLTHTDNGEWQITHRNKPKPRAGPRAGPQNAQSESDQSESPRTGDSERHSQLTLA